MGWRLGTRLPARPTSCSARIKPLAVVGFGGYPTLPPMLAPRIARSPDHHPRANAVMGRANRLLAPRVTAIATTLRGRARRRSEARREGDADRQSGAAGRDRGRRDALFAARQPARCASSSFGGSQGARIMAESCRPRSSSSTRRSARGCPSCSRRAPRTLRACAKPTPRRSVAAEVAPFFTDLPARIAAGASGHLALRRLDGRRTRRHRPPVDPGAAAARARSGPARQRQCAGRRGRRDRAPQDDFTPEAARRRARRRSRRRPDGSPQWRPPPRAAASPMRPIGLPNWC